MAISVEIFKKFVEFIETLKSFKVDYSDLPLLSIFLMGFLTQNRYVEKYPQLRFSSSKWPDFVVRKPGDHIW